MSLASILASITAERMRQDNKFGEQNHPEIDPRDIDVVTHRYAASKADIWRQVNEERATPSRSVGRCSRCPEGLHKHTAWDGVLLEEVWEALAEADPVKLRAELVQVAAVAVAWIEAIDRRAPAVEQQLAAEACGKCKQPFDPADTSFDGRARYRLTPYCRGCVDRCHDTEIADHRCVICA